LKQVGCVTIKTQNDWGSLYLALVLLISKRHQKEKVFFDEQGVKVERLSPKTVHANFLSGTCYLLSDGTVDCIALNY